MLQYYLTFQYSLRRVLEGALIVCEFVRGVSPVLIAVCSHLLQYRGKR